MPRSLCNAALFSGLGMFNIASILRLSGFKPSGQVSTHDPWMLSTACSLSTYHDSVWCLSVCIYLATQWPARFASWSRGHLISRMESHQNVVSNAMYNAACILAANQLGHIRWRGSCQLCHFSHYITSCFCSLRASDVRDGQLLTGGSRAGVSRRRLWHYIPSHQRARSQRLH